MKKRMRVMAMILAAALCVSSAPFSVSADEMETEVVTESEETEILNEMELTDNKESESEENVSDTENTMQNIVESETNSTENESSQITEVVDEDSFDKDEPVEIENQIESVSYTAMMAEEDASSDNNGQSASVGDIVYIGTYPYDLVTDESLISTLNSLEKDEKGDVLYKNRKYRYNFGDWYKYYAITWKVIDISGDVAFLMSDFMLDAHSFDTSWSTASWETCESRKWLNSTFYDNAFNDNEKSNIIASNLVNNRGNDTSDKIFFLSKAEFDTINSTYFNSVKRSYYAYSQKNLNSYNNLDICLMRDTQSIGMGYTSAYKRKDGSFQNLVMTDIMAGIRPCMRANIANIPSSYIEEEPEPVISTSPNITEDMLFSTEYCKYLDNNSYNNMISAIRKDQSEIIGNPQWNDFLIAYRTVLSAKTKGQLKIIGNNIIAAITGNNYSENKIHEELALEYINGLNTNANTAQMCGEEFISSLSKSSKVVSIIKKGFKKASDFKEVSKAFYEDFGEVDELEENLIRLSKEKEVLKNYSDYFKAAGIAISEAEIVVSLVMLKQTNIETVNYYMGLISKSSGLYAGLKNLKKKFEDGDIVTFAKEMLDKEGISEGISAIVSGIAGKETPQAAIVGAADIIYAATGYWMKTKGVLDLEEWQKAMFSIDDQMTLQSAWLNQRTKIINNVLGKESYDVEQLKKDYRAAYELYISCVLHTNGHLKNFAMGDFYYNKLNKDTVLYEGKLSYDSYIQSCLRNANASFSYVILSNGNAKIVKVNSKSNASGAEESANSILDIPKEIDGYPVTAVDSNVMTSADPYSIISLPESVVEIGDSAFENCPQLQRVFMNNNLENIGSKAFASCENLDYLDVPDTVQTIGEDAFGNNGINVTSSGITAINEYTSSGDGAIFSTRDKTVESIDISQPGNLVADANGDLKLEGAVLRVTYEDGSQEEVEGGYFINVDGIAEGNNTADVYFGGCSASCDVTLPTTDCQYTILYVDESGNYLGESVTKSAPFGSAVTLDIIDIEGYVPVEENIQKTVGNGTCFEAVYQPIPKKQISDVTAVYETEAVANGNEIKPIVSLKIGDDNLVQDEDYTISYANNIEPGDGEIWIEGIGDYEGITLFTFTIVEKSASSDSNAGSSSSNANDGKTTVQSAISTDGSASTTVSAPAASKLKKVKAGKKKATLKWKKVSGATGYEIQYGTKKNFKKAKTKTIKKAKTVKTTIKKLKAGKKYYFRIRTYKTLNGKKYYSAWSKAKKVKIK